MFHYYNNTFLLLFSNNSHIIHLYWSMIKYQNDPLRFFCFCFVLCFFVAVDIIVNIVIIIIIIVHFYLVAK